MENVEQIHVEVAYALPERQVIIELTVHQGTTLEQAREILEEAGHRSTPATLKRVEATLEALATLGDWKRSDRTRAAGNSSSSSHSILSQPRSSSGPMPAGLDLPRP